MNKYGGKTGIRELNIDDFDLDTGKCITNNGKNGLIIFYQHWCPHCTNMVGEATKANRMIGNKSVIFAVHGSAPTNKIVFDRFGIMGIPSIKFMNSYGRVTNDYNGSRDAISFFDAIKENSKKEKEDKEDKKEKKEKKDKKKQAGGSIVKKIRKHRGIVQIGGKAGKLKKGYKYSGKKLKNGQAEIVKISKK